MGHLSYVQTRLVHPRGLNSERLKNRDPKTSLHINFKIQRRLKLGTFSTETFHGDGNVGGRKKLARGRRCSRQNI